MCTAAENECICCKMVPIEAGDSWALHFCIYQILLICFVNLQSVENNWKIRKSFIRPTVGKFTALQLDLGGR